MPKTPFRSHHTPSTPPRLAGFLAFAAALASCASCAASKPREPAPLAAPALETRWTQRFGAPLGPIVNSTAAEPSADGSAWRLMLDVEYVEFLPAEFVAQTATPLSTHARLVSAALGGEPIEPRALLFDDAWWISDSGPFEAQIANPPSPFGRVRELQGVDVALLAGTTVGVEWREGEALALRLEVGRTVRANADHAALALVLEDVVAMERDGDPRTPRERVLRRESILLDDGPGADGAPVRLVLRSPFEGGGGAGLVLRLSLTDAASAEAIAAARERCEQALDLAQERSRPVGADEIRGAELAFAAAALREPRTARAALSNLAGRTGAAIAGDLALSAADAELATFTQALSASLAEQKLGIDALELGWRIERATLRWLASSRNERALPYELEAVLVRRTGELGRSSAALEDVAQSCGSLAEFAERLRDENRIFLEDRSGAVRARAFDWLAARDGAPRGYDPLAEESTRRAALAAADAAQRQP